MDEENVLTTLFTRGDLQRSSLSGNLQPSDKKLDLQKLLVEAFLELFCSSCPPYQPLSRIGLSWAKILDGPVCFFAIV